MSAEKLIEDMGEYITEVSRLECSGKSCEECKWCGSTNPKKADCIDYLIAEKLLDKGYRLASDVVEEMAEYIRKDEAVALLEKYRIELPSTYSAGLTTAKNAVRGMPIADVVPREEYADLVYKLEVVLLSATGILSKHTYDLETMTQAVQDGLNEFYNDGYGAGSAEVAREIIADLVKFADDKERQMSFHSRSVWYIPTHLVTDIIAELKKKYAESEYSNG